MQARDSSFLYSSSGLEGSDSFRFLNQDTDRCKSSACFLELGERNRNLRIIYPIRKNLNKNKTYYLTQINNND